MAHPRKVIRDAVVTRLLGVTSAGTRVSSTRVDPYRETELPAISIYTPREPVDPESSSTSPRELTRTVSVEIAASVAHSDALPLADAADAIAEQIEAAMDADPYLGGVASDSILEGTELSIPNASADPLVGLIVLTYVVTYQTQPGAITATDDFLQAGVTTQIVGAGSNNVIEDLFEVQETP